MAKSQSRQLIDLQRLLKAQQSEITRLQKALAKSQKGQTRTANRAIDAELKTQAKAGKELDKLLASLNRPKKKAAKKAAPPKKQSKPAKKSPSANPARSQGKSSKKKVSTKKGSQKQGTKTTSKKAGQKAGRTSKGPKKQGPSKVSTRQRSLRKVSPPKSPSEAASLSPEVKDALKPSYRKKVYRTWELTSKQKRRLASTTLDEWDGLAHEFDDALLPGQQWAFRIGDNDSLELYSSWAEMVARINYYDATQEILSSDDDGSRFGNLFRIVRWGQKPVLNRRDRFFEEEVRGLLSVNEVTWSEDRSKRNTRKREQHIAKEAARKEKDRKKNKQRKVIDKRRKEIASDIIASEKARRKSAEAENKRLKAELAKAKNRRRK